MFYYDCYYIFNSHKMFIAILRVELAFVFFYDLHLWRLIIDCVLWLICCWPGLLIYLSFF